MLACRARPSHHDPGAGASEGRERPTFHMVPTPRLAWLFDVDGTLLLTEGAAREAFARTVREVLGIDDDLRDIAFAGRTEPLILGDIMAAHGRTLSTEDEARFWNVVFDHMRRLLGPDRGRLLP